MANKIKIRRGQKTNLPLPNTELWELRYAHDTAELFIDDGTNNVLLATNDVATDMNTAVKTAIDAKVNTSDVATTATANKILKLDANAKLPASITGNADGNAATATKLQTVRTINGVNFDGSANITINAVDSIARIASSEKGAINGVATLDTAGKVPASQLPSYVDDVLEYADYAGFPATGEASKIYVALDVNLVYRWGGSNYVEISPSIALGETSTTAYRGDRGKIAYDHSQLTGGTNPHNTTFANISTKPTTVAGYGITDGATLTGTQTLTNKTISSPIITGTPTGITATHVGLGNVTNNAQVKKIASSTDNAIMRFDGTTGDLPQDSLVTISDTGTVNIPSGQSYNVNSVALKDVSETLTNKTLTSPILNGEVTGTAITTIGEPNKLVKMSSVGNINMTQSLDGSIGMILNNTSAGVNASTGFQAKGNNINYLSVWTYGSGRAGIIFGKTMGSHSALLAQGSDNAGLLLGTLSNAPLVIGTNGVERYNIGSNGNHTFTTPATTSYNAIFRNASYATTDTSGTSSIKIGYSNHDGVKIEAYKDTAFNISGIKFYGEYGIGNEKLLLNLKSSNGSVEIPSLAGTGNRLVTADASGNLSASGIITKRITHQPYNFTAYYGVNYVNSGTGGQNIQLPPASLGIEVEIISKTQGVNTFLTMSGTNKIYDINGNDVTSVYTATYGLSSVKKIKFIGALQIERDGATSGAVDWVVVERENNLAGIGSRMVVADSNGNLSAPLNKFTTTYYEGAMASVPNDIWTVLIECPTGKTTLALTTAESFSATTLYYSQAEFARAAIGTPVVLYAVNSGGQYATQARINGNNIEIMHSSGAATRIQYRYIVENSRI